MVHLNFSLRWFLMAFNWQDMTTIDSSLAGSLQSVNSSLASFFAAIITVALVWFYFKIGMSSNQVHVRQRCISLLPDTCLFIGFAYWELAIGYLNTGRDLRRMESNTRSPISSDFGEVLEGIVTIRAFLAEKKFLNNVFVKIDTTTKVGFFCSVVTNLCLFRCGIIFGWRTVGFFWSSILGGFVCFLYPLWRTRLVLRVYASRVQ